MDRSEMQSQIRKENMELASKMKKSVLAKFMHSEGYVSVPYYEYYRDMFPSGELAQYSEHPSAENESQYFYNGIVLMDTGRTKNITKMDYMGEDIHVKVKTKTRLMVFDDLYAIDVAVNKALKDGKQSLLSPISYCGRSRATENERFLYALIIEIDGLKTTKIKGKRDHEQSGMKTLLHQIKNNLYLSPTYIVCSGNGVHLVWLLNEPMPLTNFPSPKKFDYEAEKRKERKRRRAKKPSISSKHKKGNNFTLHWDTLRSMFTDWVWNKSVSKECVQLEYHGQGFRTVGSIGKQGHLVEVFRICDRRYSMVELFTQPGTLCKRDLTPMGVPLLEFMASFTKSYYEKEGLLKKEVNGDKVISEKLKEAKEKWPDWYERRIVRKELPRQRGEWNVSENVYNWYRELIQKEAFVGCRYWRLYTLAQYARKCHIPFDDLHADGVEIGELFKVIDDGASLNDSDIEKALADGYLNILAPKSAIDFINEKAQVGIQKNPRNGRKRQEHLQAEHLSNADGRPIMNPCKQNRELALQYMRENHEIPGRPEKYDVVHKWRTENPNGKKADCIRETGLSKPTVYKWWDIA